MPDRSFRNLVTATLVALGAMTAPPASADAPPIPTAPPDGASSPPPAPEPPPLASPSAEEVELLTGELALLDRAARRRVTVPADARTLRELLESLSAQAEIPIDADWDDLVSLGVSADDPPPITRGSGSLIAVLDSLCLGLGVPFARPQPEPMIGRIRIVAPSTVAERRRTRVYHADALADDFLVQAAEHIDPEGWLRNGGDRQHASVMSGALLISAPPSVHRRLEALLDELRMTRPAAIELSAEMLRVPAAAWRTLAMSDGSTPITPATVAAIAGVERIATPTIVTLIDHEAVTESSNDATELRLVVRPERGEADDVHVRFELVVEERPTASAREPSEPTDPVRAATSKASSQGTIPAPVAGPPALVSIELPGSEHAVVVFLRARPVARVATISAR